MYAKCFSAVEQYQEMVLDIISDLGGRGERRARKP
jgi:hypothetical protein